MDENYCKRFEQKCKEGTLTCRDKREFYLEVLKDSGIKINNRAEKNLVNLLKNSLHNFKSNGSETAHVLVHDLLTCMSPFMNLDEEEYKKYNELYQQYSKKHNEHCVFKHNYKSQ